MATAASPSGRPGRLLVFTDSTTNRQFLVDKGTAYSIVPHSSPEPAVGPAIMAADRSPISCWGSCVETITSDRYSFKWSFLQAAAAFPIIGVDFLNHFKLAVDITNRRLTHSGRLYVKLSAPQSSGQVGVVAVSSPTPTAGVAQQPHAASLCARPPAAVISQQLAGVAQLQQAASLCAWPPAADIYQQPTGVAQQQQTASLCARPPYSDTTPKPLGWVTPAERKEVAVAQQPQAASLCAWPLAAVISQQPAGVGWQPQAASLCAKPPAVDIRCPTAPFSQAQVAAEFPRVLTSPKKLPAVRHKVQHIIETTCRRPISTRYRWLDPEKLEAARKEFAEIETQCIVRRSNSSWSSPLHMVEKADSTWRQCGDYRLLNLATKPNLYLPPHMEDLSARLAGMTVFLQTGPEERPLPSSGGRLRRAEDCSYNPLRIV